MGLSSKLFREGALRGALSRSPALACDLISRPTRFEDFRYLGDKRKQVVYDLDRDNAETQSRVAELMASERFAAFGPDTLAEARNRGYRPFEPERRDD